MTGVTRSSLCLNAKPKLKLWRFDGEVTCSRLWLKSKPNFKLWRFDGKLTRSRLWLNASQNSSLEDLMANHPLQAFGWTKNQNSSLEDSIARSHAPSFGWNHYQDARFEDSMARSHAPGFGWTHHQNSSLQGCGADDVNTLQALLLQVASGPWSSYSLSHKLGAHIHKSMQRTHWLVCKCRTALSTFQQSLALPRFDPASAFHSHDAWRALRLADMEAPLTPISTGPTQA